MAPTPAGGKGLKRLGPAAAEPSPKRRALDDNRKYPQAKKALPSMKPRPSRPAGAAGSQPRDAKFFSKPRTGPAREPGSKVFKPSAAKGVKLTKHDLKDKVRAKNLAIKKNFGLIEDAVVLWEALRPKMEDSTSEEKQELVSQIMAKVDGKLVELSAHHTASRIIQFCARHGTPEQRTRILEQIKANILVLSKSKYGHHVVRKLISTAPKQDIPGLVKQFQGHVAELLRHPQGADVMTDLYDAAPAAQRNAMCAEFYGREFALFGGASTQGVIATNLSALLKDQGATKRRSVMQHMTKALIPIMEKAILHPPMVHRLLRDFIECAPSSSVEDAVDTLSATGAALLKMVHTHEGATVVCGVLAYGSAKDRKRVIKAMKGFVRNMAVNEWGHVVLMTALSVVDDTQVLAKVVAAELKAMLDEAVEDAHAIRVLLQLLAPDNTRLFPPTTLAMIHPPTRIVKGSSGKIVTEIEDGMGNDEQEQEEDHGMAQDDGDENDDIFAPKAGSKTAGKVKGHKAGKAKGQEAEEEDEEAPALGPDGERVLGVSKKGSDARRKELLAAGGVDSLAAALTQVVASNAGGLLRLPLACDLVVELARGGEGGLLLELAPQGVAAVHEALILEASQPAPGQSPARPQPAAEGATDKGRKSKKRKADAAEPAQPEGQQGAGEAAGAEGGVQGPGVQAEHVFTQWHAGRALRRLLINAEGGAAESGAAAFASALWTRALLGKCRLWVGTHGEKVLAALLRCGVPAVQAAAAAELRPLVAPMPLEKWAAARLAGTQHHAAKLGGAGGKQPQQQGGAAAWLGGSGSKPGQQQGQPKGAATPAKPDSSASAGPKGKRGRGGDSEPSQAAAGSEEGPAPKRTAAQGQTLQPKQMQQGETPQAKQPQSAGPGKAAGGSGAKGKRQRFL